MGFARKRVGKDGNTRYTATYVDLRGSIRSAGTFASEKAADQAWQKAEVELRQGRVGDPARGRQTFRKYVEERWLPNHVLEPTTREKYTYYLGAYIVPALGPMRMADIFPEHIRELDRHDAARGTFSVDDPVLQKLDPQLDLHDRAQRSGHLYPPMPGCQDSHGARHAADHPHPGAVRCDLRDATGRRCPAPGGNGHRKRAPLGRADRTAGQGSRYHHPDADREPQGHRTQPGVPPRRQAVPRPALSQGQGVPAAQAQRADHRQAQGP